MRCDEQHSEYLRDESRRVGRAEEVYFPRDADELETLLSRLRDEGVHWTVQGGRTGIYGSAVPDGGAIVNLSALTGIVGMAETSDGGFSAFVAAGATLSAVQDFCRTRRVDVEQWDEASRRVLARFARAGKWIFPVEPSETSATVGGIFATDAKGVSIRQFGPTHTHIAAVRSFCGAAAVLELRLIPAPAERWGLFFFFADADAARAFALGVSLDMATVDCILFDVGVLSLIQRHRRHVAMLKELPDFPAGGKHGVYVEMSCADGEDGRLEQLLERFSEMGGCDEDTWAESGPGMEKLRLPYHAALELEGMRFDELRRKAPELDRQCREFVVPPSGYEMFLRCCLEESDRVGMEALLFSCAPRGHVHLGLMAADAGESVRAGELFAAIARQAEALGGGLAREFGLS